MRTATKTSYVLLGQLMLDILQSFGSEQAAFPRPLRFYFGGGDPANNTPPRLYCLGIPQGRLNHCDIPAETWRKALDLLVTHSGHLFDALTAPLELARGEVTYPITPTLFFGLVRIEEGYDTRMIITPEFCHHLLFAAGGWPHLFEHGDMTRVIIRNHLGGATIDIHVHPNDKGRWLGKRGVLVDNMRAIMGPLDIDIEVM